MGAFWLYHTCSQWGHYNICYFSSVDLLRITFWTLWHTKTSYCFNKWSNRLLFDFAKFASVMSPISFSYCGFLSIVLLVWSVLEAKIYFYIHLWYPSLIFSFENYLNASNKNTNSNLEMQKYFVCVDIHVQPATIVIKISVVNTPPFLCT